MEEEEMLPEYDLTGGVRGRHYEAYRRGPYDSSSSTRWNYYYFQ
jgi:hypothetical protein